jgi:hypothetical protein
LRTRLVGGGDLDGDLESELYRLLLAGGGDLEPLGDLARRFGGGDLESTCRARRGGEIDLGFGREGDGDLVSGRLAAFLRGGDVEADREEEVTDEDRPRRAGGGEGGDGERGLLAWAGGAA